MRDRMTVTQVAKALKLTRQRVHQLIKAGALTPTDTVSEGAEVVLYMFSRSEVERFARVEGRTLLEA